MLSRNKDLPPLETRENADLKSRPAFSKGLKTRRCNQGLCTRRKTALRVAGMTQIKIATATTTARDAGRDTGQFEKDGRNFCKSAARLTLAGGYSIQSTGTVIAMARYSSSEPMIIREAARPGETRR